MFLLPSTGHWTNSWSNLYGQKVMPVQLQFLSWNIVVLGWLSAHAARLDQLSQINGQLRTAKGILPICILYNLWGGIIGHRRKMCPLYWTYWTHVHTFKKAMSRDLGFFNIHHDRSFIKSHTNYVTWCHIALLIWK